MTKHVCEKCGGDDHVQRCTWSITRGYPDRWTGYLCVSCLQSAQAKGEPVRPEKKR